MTAMLASLLLAVISVSSLWNGRADKVKLLEQGQLFSTLLMTLSSVVLLSAFINKDFSYRYVFEYSDSFLPLFYRITAFWAGQAGSLLFWALSMAVLTCFFIFTKANKQMDTRTRSWFWAFYFGIQAFFLLILTGPSNPFIELSPALPEGNGLNPLLRNPGMVFHPPLLFWGYAGFTVPACLAMAATMTGKGDAWLKTARFWSLLSWAFLTAGIILGAWWAYMELGWGGYWAWDPVENASLIPWFSSTAFLHTAVIQERSRTLHKTNVFLIGLTFILCIFATYLVRSGVIDSLHAFGSGGVGPLLLYFMILSVLILLGTIFVSGKTEGAKDLGDFMSRQGFLVMATWLFLALGIVVFLGTMWPVISKIWSANPVGLDQGFYNRVCLPLFTLAAVMLVFCPWIGWKEGLRDKKYFIIVSAALVPALAFYWFIGIRIPLALVASAFSTVAILGIILLFVRYKNMIKSGRMLGAYSVHVGLALVVIGVAFSGPYEETKEVMLKKGESFEMAGYSFTYEEMLEESGQAMAKAEARLTVTKDGEPHGVLRPQRRVFRNYDQPFAEVSVIPSLGTEVYATLLGFNEARDATFKVSTHPLVNWLWIGGTIMSLAPFLGMFGAGKRKENEN
jgi:cytochrome c-type biogenesis protein CcmF